jgi:molybdate transport system substrate-binding protein
MGWALPGSAVFAQSDKSASPADAAKPLRVAAAASLRGPLDQALAAWRQAGGTAATITYAGTPALVRQIEQGLPADLFFSADSDWMDHLAGRGGLRPQTRRDLLGNRLVLIARPGVETVLPPEVRSSGVELGKGDTADRALRAALGNGPGRTRLALAEVGSVPAGRYARAALEALNLWQPWSSRLAMTDNVRAALLLVARGETDLGIVYASDAQLEPRIRVVATFADSLHPPIRYPAAVLASATHPRALEALEFLAQPAAIKRFLEAGFTAPGPAARP